MPTRAREFHYPARQAVSLLDGQTPELGDELALDWQGEWKRPLLAPRGRGRPAIIVALDDQTVTLSLIDEGLAARRAQS